MSNSKMAYRTDIATGPSLVSMDFHGDQIVTFQHDGEPYVAMRRVVENLGLNWAGQHAKLIERSNLSCMDIHTTGSDGKTYQMLAMPVAKLPLWLATINPNKIPDSHKRAKIELYQSESAIALHDYWTKGIAVRGDMDGMVTDLDPKVMKALGGMFKGIVHKELSLHVAEVLPSLVEREVLAGRYSVVMGVSALEVLEMAGHGRGKRPKGASQFVSCRLARYCEDRGVPVRRSRHGSASLRLFDEVTARRWLDEGGRSEIDHYIAGRKGQGALRLV